MTTHIIKSSEVFVPGGIPTYTYNPRKSKNIEDKLEDSATSFKLIVVTGPTKSGKTVLVNKIFPRGEALWIDGGSITSEDNFWEQVVSELGGYTEEQLEQGRELQCTLDGQFGANVAIAKAELTGAVSRTDKSTVIKTSHMTNKSKAITLLQNEKVPVVIDDRQDDRLQLLHLFLESAARRIAQYIWATGNSHGMGLCRSQSIQQLVWLLRQHGRMGYKMRFRTARQPNFRSKSI